MQNNPEPVVGKRIAFLGNLSHKKGVELMIHSFNIIHKFDPEFQLFIGGIMQDSRYACFLDYCIPRLDLQDSIHYYGYVDDVISWFEDKDFLLISSPLEGCPVGALEGLSCGKTPLFYDFVGAEDLFPSKFIWKDFDQLISMIQAGPKNPQIFKDFVKDNYSQEKQFKEIDFVVKDLLKDTTEIIKLKKNSTASCVIAVKNGEKTIERAITSLQNQTYPLEKIVIVNDGSTDNTFNITNKMKSDSEIPIEIINNQISKWVFSARNDGFERIDSDYFFFLDADDWVDSTYVEKMVHILDDNSRIDVVYPDMVYFNEKGEEKVFNQTEFNAQNLAQHNFIAYCSMQRTSVFRELGKFSAYMNDCRNHLTEWELWLRYVKNGKGFVHLSEPLFHYFHDDSVDQMSSGYERSRDDMSLELALTLTDDKNDIQMTNKNKRIVLVCQGKDYCDRSKVGFELMQVYKPLGEFGDVFTFQYDVEMKHYGRAAMQERLKEFLDLIKPNYVFHFSYKNDILIETWNEVSKKYCTIVWHSDDDRRFDQFTNSYGSAFKYAITTYPTVYERMYHPGRILSQWGVNQYYFKSAFDMNLVEGSFPIKKSIDVSFVGQRYGDRGKLLGGLSIEKYGLGWDAGFVDFKEVGRIFAKSKISVSLAAGADGNKQIKLRTFEICVCNTLCLCEYVEGIKEFFIPGKEIVFFRTRDELEEKIKYYLEHENERKEIAQAGYERTIKDHLWRNRFEKIFKEIDGE